jgi:hypothetical protein
MSGDDDTIIIRGGKKIAAALTKPVTSLKRWHVVAIAVAAFILGKL